MDPIVQHPDPRLRMRAEPVASFDAQLHHTVQRLQAAMDAGLGGVGIAAPQIGLGLRLVLVDASRAQRPCPNHGALILINPEIVEFDAKAQLGREGCLSVPQWVGTVARARRILLRYRDREGNEQQLESSGFEARVIQHELDHLDGILFIDRVESSNSLLRRMELGANESA